VNYALFNNIYQFLTDHNIQFPDEDLWKSRLKRIVSVGHILVRQNKSLPLIGDTEGHIGAFFPFVEGDLSDGIGYYPKSGFFVYKVGEIYFTLRGGGSSFSHRHVDDTSITLFYKGEDFIVDPGMYNYDSSDKLRRWFTSPNAHSGFYLESAGMARYSKFSGPESVGGLKDLTINDNGFDIGAWHDLCPESRVYRAISFDGKSILLSDSFYSGFDCKWTQSFHLHPNATIELAIDRRSATISSCNAKIMITIISEGSYIELVTGHYSSTFMAKQDAATIAIRGCSPCISLHTRVDLL
jgi:hypothetical protein